MDKWQNNKPISGYFECSYYFQKYGWLRCIFHSYAWTIFKYYFDTNLLLSSISNLLIKTDTIKTFLKSLSLKHFLDNFNTLLLSPFPKAKNSKQRSLKLFVLQLFGKLMPFYQMLVSSRQSHYTQKMGP